MSNKNNDNNFKFGSNNKNKIKFNSQNLQVKFHNFKIHKKIYNIIKFKNNHFKIRLQLKINLKLTNKLKYNHIKFPNLNKT